MENATDYYGNDITNFSPMSVDDCLSECDKLKDCLAVQYHAESSSCWMKWKYPLEVRYSAAPSQAMYYKDGFTSPLSISLKDVGWYIDENLESDSENLPYNGPDKDFIASSAYCESTSCFVKTIIPAKIKSGYDSTKISHSLGLTLSTRTAVVNHFVLLNYTHYIGFNGPFLTPKYTMAACMTECFHNPQCQFAYFSRNSLKCALLSHLNMSSLIYDYDNYSADMQILNKTWQYDAQFSALPNYVASILYPVNAINTLTNTTAASCLKQCNSVDFAICSFDYSLKSCIKSIFTDLNSLFMSLSFSSANAMTFINKGVIGADIVPFLSRPATTEPAVVSNFQSQIIPTELLEQTLSNCSVNLLCQRISQIGEIQMPSSGLSESDTLIQMDVNVLTFKVIDPLNIQSIPGFVIQPYAQMLSLNQSSLKFPIEECWGNSKCNKIGFIKWLSGLMYVQYTVDQFGYSNSVVMSILPENKIIFKSTIGSQFTEYNNVTLVYSYYNVTETLVNCLNECFMDNNCVFVFYDFKFWKCALTTESGIGDLDKYGTLLNQYTPSMTSLKKKLFVNYKIFVNTTLLSFVSVTNLTLSEEECIKKCSNIIACYGFLYTPFRRNCNLVHSGNYSTKADPTVVWYKRLVFEKSLYRASSTSIVPLIIESMTTAARSNQNEPPPNEILKLIQGNIYLIIGLFCGILSLGLIAWLINRKLKIPKSKLETESKESREKSKFDHGNHTNEIEKRHDKFNKNRQRLF